MSYISSYYKDLLDFLYREHGFDNFLASDSEEQDFYDWHCGVSKSLPLKITNGASKGVIIDYSLPYVLKIPFNYYNDEACDYCNLELENYIAATQVKEISDCFAWTDFLFMYHGYPIYIMEKVECNSSKVESKAFYSSYHSYCKKSGIVPSEKSRVHFETIFHRYGNEARMDALLMEQLGRKSTKIFWDFCDDNNINDLHEENWGFRGNKLVLVDYSGYHGESGYYNSSTY